MAESDTAIEGGCYCGAVRYRLHKPADRCALCHCRDCQHLAGAPGVVWGAWPLDCLEMIKGETVKFASSQHATREFCGTCGTGLFYTNPVVLPGILDVQVITLDNPESVPPQAHIQYAERMSWMHNLGDLPAFERYPGME